MAVTWPGEAGCRLEEGQEIEGPRTPSDALFLQGSVTVPSDPVYCLLLPASVTDF